MAATACGFPVQAAVLAELFVCVLQLPVQRYDKDIAENASLTRQEVVAKLKRNSTGFSRCA